MRQPTPARDRHRRPCPLPHLPFSGNLNRDRRVGRRQGRATRTCPVSMTSDPWRVRDAAPLRDVGPPGAVLRGGATALRRLPPSDIGNTDRDLSIPAPDARSGARPAARGARPPRSAARPASRPGPARLAAAIAATDWSTAWRATSGRQGLTTRSSAVHCSAHALASAATPRAARVSGRCTPGARPSERASTRSTVSSPAASARALSGESATGRARAVSSQASSASHRGSRLVRPITDGIRVTRRCRAEPETVSLTRRASRASVGWVHRG